MKKNVTAGLICSMIICGGLWTITFPHQMFPREAVTVYEEENGEERELTMEEMEKLSEMLKGAEQGQIRIRSHLWEWVKKRMKASEKS